jgi:hypothetical protein
MNPDDFEKQLQRQPSCQPPAAWREEILTAARSNIRAPRRAGESDLLTGWRALLARIPLAWGAVAALWLVIIGVNSLMSGPVITVIASTPAPPQREAMTVWSLQRAEIGLLANGLADAPDIAPRRETPGVPPRPRSDRRRDDGFSELGTTLRHSTLA